MNNTTNNPAFNIMKELKAMKENESNIHSEFSSVLFFIENSSIFFADEGDVEELKQMILNIKSMVDKNGFNSITINNI